MDTRTSRPSAGPSKSVGGRVVGNTVCLVLRRVGGVDVTNRSDSFPSKQTMDYSNWTSALTRGSEATSKGAPLASNQLPAVAWLAEEGTSDSVGFDSMQFDLRFAYRTPRRNRKVSRTSSYYHTTLFPEV